MIEKVLLTETPSSLMPRLCRYCHDNRGYWIIKKGPEPHGEGVWCAACNRFDAWLPKGKQKNDALKKRNLAKGEYCRFCGITREEAELAGRDFTAILDHIQARDFGGGHSEDNTQILCGLCSYLKTAMEHQTRSLRKMVKRYDENSKHPKK